MLIRHITWYKPEKPKGYIYHKCSDIYYVDWVPIGTTRNDALAYILIDWGNPTNDSIKKEISTVIKNLNLYNVASTSKISKIIKEATDSIDRIERMLIDGRETKKGLKKLIEIIGKHRRP